MTRKVQQTDIDAIYQLLIHLEQHEISKEKFEQVFAKNMADNSIFYFVEEFGNQIIGFISLHIQYLLHHAGKVGEIQELVVRENWEGKGTGKKLFNAVKEIALQEQCVNLEVTCNQKRTRTHLFYEKQGMKKSHFKFVMEL